VNATGAFLVKMSTTVEITQKTSPSHAESALIPCLSAKLEELIVRSHHALKLSSGVMASQTVLLEKMSWSTTVPVSLKEQ
jgi:hypothetical protein